MKPELIHRHFINGVQGKVQLKKGRLQVDIYGFKHRAVVERLFTNLEQKLIARGMDPRVPWLNNHILKFKFA